MHSSPVVIITGAGSGIGRATALALAADGYALALVGRDDAKLRATQELAAPAKVESLIIAADIQQPAECRRIVAQTHAAFGRIDALANVAGHAGLEPIAKVTEASWSAMVDTNLTAVVHLTAAAWPHLAVKGGTIVNVSSMASIDPFPGFATYAAAKVAVNMFTRCTANEGAKQGIKAVAIAPGAVETPMLRSLFNEKMIPAARALAAADVAQIIADCITGKRPFTAGETIQVKSP